MEEDIEIKKYLWGKAISVDGYDGNRYRKDVCGAWIRWGEYGRIGADESHTSRRWSKDHIVPVAEGGSAHPSNLRALQWYNNQMKSDGHHRCHVTSRGDENVLI
ncbi:MAG: hypothetical protein MPJ08_01140 [Nitrosopumilus sp.]|nr:hypothetical protein [Nitrosopumilus sp.]